MKLGTNDITLKLGSINVDAAYLGTELVYSGETPFNGKFKAKYSSGSDYTLACDGDTTLSSGNTRPNGYEYSAMTEAVIGDCVTSIGVSAFRDCTSLTSVDIPSGVTSIGNFVFRDCTSLTSVDIPSGVTSISAHLFRNCSSLKSVDIPSGVTSIGNNAFEGCYSLTNIVIPSGVTNINSSTFKYCTSLTSVDIPSGVTSFGNNAFAYCSGLTSITVNAVTPPTLGIASLVRTNDCPIYVPSGSVADYQTAWSDFSSRIQAIPSPPTLQWVEYSNGDSIPANLDIYGISGVSQDLANTWGYDSSKPMQFNPSRNKIDINIYCNEQICYNSTDSGSPLATDAVSFIFHDIGCCDYVNQAATVSGTVMLYIYA